MIDYTPNLGRRGAPWTPDEEDQLRRRFLAGETLLEMAIGHERGVHGIIGRLQRMHLVEYSPDARGYIIPAELFIHYAVLRDYADVETVERQAQP